MCFNQYTFSSPISVATIAGDMMQQKWKLYNVTIFILQHSNNLTDQGCIPGTLEHMHRELSPIFWVLQFFSHQLNVQDVPSAQSHQLTCLPNEKQPRYQLWYTPTPMITNVRDTGKVYMRSKNNDVLPFRCLTSSVAMSQSSSVFLNYNVQSLFLHFICIQ